MTTRDQVAVVDISQHYKDNMNVLSRTNIKENEDSVIF